MTRQSMPTALITYPDGHVEAEPVLVDVIDETTVTFEIEGMLVGFDAKELRRAVGQADEGRAAA